MSVIERRSEQVSVAGHENRPTTRPPPSTMIGPVPAVEPERAWRGLLDAAALPYRSSGRFAWHFARGKLGWDPIFRGLLERGDIAPGSRIVDIGCGQGLLASLVAACAEAAADGRWPADWGMAPAGATYTGIELMPRDVERACRALAALPSRPRFVCADMTRAELPVCDVVVILDVLHYVDLAAQEALLRRVFGALGEGGRLLLRIGDQRARSGFLASQWVDRIVTAVRGHRVAPTFCRPLDEWRELLLQIGFARVDAVPMHRGTPFANMLLVAER